MPSAETSPIRQGHKAKMILNKDFLNQKLNKHLGDNYLHWGSNLLKNRKINAF
jgi:hypothetical protein